MADSTKAAAKAAKKEERAAKRAKRRQNYKQLWQAFNIQRKRDKALIPIMLGAVVGLALVFFLIGLLFHGQWFMLVLGIAFGFMLAMWLFTRRLEASMYDEAGDTPGAAGWALENMRNTMGMVWFTKTAVAATTHMDVVHRVVGVPGIVLVGEGRHRALTPLMNQQKKRLNRLAGGVPIYEIYVGNGEGEVPLKKLQRHLLKLPRNYRKNDVYPINSRIEAMDASRRPGDMPGMPKGPMPNRAKMSGMNRRARRHADRTKNQ